MEQPKVTEKLSHKGKKYNLILEMIIISRSIALFKCIFIYYTNYYRYDNISRMVPDQFSHLLEEIHKLETELGHLPQKWKVLWDKLELPNTDSLTRHASFSTALVRHHGRLIHKRSTLELLLRGKLAGGNTTGNESSVYAHPHRFERLDSATPTHCDACSGVLWGPVKAGLRCVDCGHVCHDKCADAVPKNCTKYKAVADSLQSHTLTRSGGDNGSVNSSKYIIY